MKSRKAPDNNNNLKPVEKIELSEKHIKLRVVLVILFIVLALAAFAVGIIFWLSTDAGWREIEADATDINCSSEFVFYYEIQESGLAGTEELDAVSKAYGEAAVDAYRIFNATEEFEGVNNLAYVNANINSEVTVNGSLYRAFELMESYGSRLLYFAPAYVYYDNLLYSVSDDMAAQNDPYRNDELADIIAQIAEFANDENSINLELLGDNRVRLNVSDEYAAFVAEYGLITEDGVTVYLDLFMLRNAFIIDYLADYLISADFTHGLISSYDGYTRTLSRRQQFEMDVFDKTDDGVFVAGNVSGSGEVSAVRFRDYYLGGSDYGYKYGYSDGDCAHNYIDSDDGLYKSSISDLITYSSEMGCAELMLNVLPVYTSDGFDESAISQLMRDKYIYSVYCLDTELVYNDENLEAEAYSNEERSYTLRFAG